MAEASQLEAIQKAAGQKVEVNASERHAPDREKRGFYRKLAAPHVSSRQVMAGVARLVRSPSTR